MRKCVLVLLALILSWGSLYAQDDSSSGGGNFDAGDLAFEITGSPFSHDMPSSSDGTFLSFGSFRARYAVTTNIVPRFGVNMDLYNNQVSPDVVINNSAYTLMPGCEYHFRIDGGFRSYAAFDVLIGQQFSSYESTTGSSISGANYNPATTSSESSGNVRGYFMYGVSAGVGADYHFGSNFYIGAEIGFQLAQYKFSDIEVDGELYEKGVQASTGSINTMNSIRIGFKFL